ncbi:MAG: hypothetical protein M0Z30_15920 [Actinomycetota bacterium]|nr:hypothetical protein [Actinomycetota bacterium]
MSAERAWVVGLPSEPGLLSLVGDVRSAHARATKAEPGDRLDIARFEALATRLEQQAVGTPSAPRRSVAVPSAGDCLIVGASSDDWAEGLPADIREAATSFVSDGLIPVLIVDANSTGDTLLADRGAGEDPADPWQADDGVYGGKAVEARFRAQIQCALDPDEGRRLPISPSGINNAVVTEILREFVANEPDTRRVDAPVLYRDGSKSAHPFPLRSLALSDSPSRPSLELKFALLSIRHTEMDAVVDGAWLRNAEISRPRPAAQTDDLVYEISLTQLEELCRNESHVRLYIYQTGLETAVMGFYRAVTAHLLRHPGSVSVQPMYFVAPPRPRPDPRQQNRGQNRNGAKGGGRNARPGAQRKPSAPEQSHRESAPPQRSLVEESTTFRKGKPWQM